MVPIFGHPVQWFGVVTQMDDTFANESTGNIDIGL